MLRLQATVLREQLRKLVDVSYKSGPNAGYVTRPVELGNIQTISYSVHREKFPVRCLGKVYPKAYTRGPRTIAGSFIFTILREQALSDLLNAGLNFYNTGVTTGNDSAYPELSTILVDQLPSSQPGQVSGGDLDLVEREAQRITIERKAFRADQFQLNSHPQAHFLHTAQEILRQTGGKLDAFCDFVGTAGSFAGCTTAFKEYNPEIKCYLVEPATAAVLADKPVNNPNHRIQGGGYSMTELPFINPGEVDGFIQVTDEQAIQMARALARKEGIFAGYSAGANVAAAMSLLKGELSGATIVVLLSDSGLKYLSTDLWA